MDHNFKEVIYGFPTINGNEITVSACVISENGCSIAKSSHGSMMGSVEQVHEQTRANARRIAACINYCKNLSTEELEGEG